MSFNYQAAFSRNLGWVTEKEQLKLCAAKVAIAGLGGVGGDHALDCARLGIGKFSIADFDTFDLPNFNRQAGASMATLGRAKIDVMRDALLDINPDAQLSCFAEGINEANLDAFLDGADVYLDSLDLFALDMRRLIFAKCYEKGIPAITAAPIGMGTALMVFRPGQMSFEDYFAFKHVPANANEQERQQIFNENILRFIVGVAPSGQQRQYLASPESVDISAGRVPSTRVGVSLAAGVLCTNVVKVILQRGNVVSAPYGLHFDAYRNKLIKTWRPGGNRNPLQRILLWHISRSLKRSEPPLSSGLANVH